MALTLTTVMPLLPNETPVWVAALSQGTMAHRPGTGSRCAVMAGATGYRMTVVQAHVHLRVVWCRRCFPPVRKPAPVRGTT